MKTEKELIKTIYEHFGDEYSKKIFVNRYLYSVTKDNEFLKNIINLSEEGREFLERFYSAKKVFIFGCGSWGKEIVNSFPDKQIVAFVDNNKNHFINNNWNGIPIYSFEDFLRMFESDTIIVISSRLYHIEMEKQLVDNGIEKINILNAGKMVDELSKRQYFDLPELNNNDVICENEVFVDAGGFDGQTSIMFFEWCKQVEKKGKKKAIIFEPDINNLNVLNDNLRSYIRGECDDYQFSFQVFEKGLWSKKKKLSFKRQSTGASKVDEEGDWEIEVDKLDDLVADQTVTFLKMDLEGSEIDAIYGAEMIIRSQRPKLAISIYHKKDDIWRIPELLLEMQNDYRFFLRHYSIGAAETVLYAI